MLKSGSRLGDRDRYLVSRVLGSGNFSTVYLARDQRLAGKYVAVKEFDPAAFSPEDQVWARETIRHEATLRASLASHPYLADVTDYFEANDREYLVLEYVEGETLRHKWEQQPGQRFDEQLVLNWAGQLLTALHFLHGHEPPVIYRDLKPENIMVRPDGTLKLIDFGIARFHSGDKQGDTVSLGTRGYAAPEQYGQAESDTRTDIYALGVLLHQLLSGVDPTQHVFSMPSLQQARPDVSPHVALAIDQAMNPNPDARFRSARALGGALGVPLSGVLPGSVAAAPVNGSEPDSGGFPWRVPLIAVAVLLLFGIAGGSLAAMGIISLNDDEPIVPANSLAEATPVRPTRTTTALPEASESPGAEPVEVMAVEAENGGLSGAGGSRPTKTPVPTKTPLPSSTPNPTLTPMPTDTPTPAPLSYRDRPIVFDADRNRESTNVFIMDWDGTNLRQLTNSSAIEEEADLSPNGQEIAYERKAGNDWYIYVMDVNGRDQRRLVAGREPDWSPDGRYLAYESPLPENIMLYDFNGGGVRELFGSPRRDRAPSWSPDGQRIAFMSETSGYWQIYVVDINVGRAEQISSDAVNKRFPVWSPDGELLAYNTMVGDTFQIWTIEPDGENARQLTTGGSNGRPAWSPDGNYLIFNSNRSGAWRIWRIDRDGSNPQQLSPEGSGHGDQRPDWGAYRVEE